MLKAWKRRRRIGKPGGWWGLAWRSQIHSPLSFPFRFVKNQIITETTETQYIGKPNGKSYTSFEENSHVYTFSSLSTVQRYKHIVFKYHVTEVTVRCLYEMKYLSSRSTSLLTYQIKLQFRHFGENSGFQTSTWNCVLYRIKIPNFINLILMKCWYNRGLKSSKAFLWVAEK